MLLLRVIGVIAPNLPSGITRHRRRLVSVEIIQISQIAIAPQIGMLRAVIVEIPHHLACGIDFRNRAFNPNALTVQLSNLAARRQSAIQHSRLPVLPDKAKALIIGTRIFLSIGKRRNLPVIVDG